MNRCKRGKQTDRPRNENQTPPRTPCRRLCPPPHVSRLVCSAGGYSVSTRSFELLRPQRRPRGAGYSGRPLGPMEAATASARIMQVVVEAGASLAARNTRSSWSGARCTCWRSASGTLWARCDCCGLVRPRGAVCCSLDESSAVCSLDVCPCRRLVKTSFRSWHCMHTFGGDGCVSLAWSQNLPC